MYLFLNLFIFLTYIFNACTCRILPEIKYSYLYVLYNIYSNADHSCKLFKKDMTFTSAGS